MRPQIGVIGGSQSDSRHLEMAYRVGRLLAKRGAVVICGGLLGVMEAVAKGVEDEGGISIGILPGLNPLEGNPHLTIGLPTGVGFARNFLIVRASDALIAIDGSNGTLSEASFALVEGKSVVSLESVKLTKQKETEGSFIEASTPEEAVERALAEAERHRMATAPGR